MNPFARKVASAADDIKHLIIRPRPAPKPQGIECRDGSKRENGPLDLADPCPFCHHHGCWPHAGWCDLCRLTYVLFGDKENPTP